MISLRSKQRRRRKRRKRREGRKGGGGETEEGKSRRRKRRKRRRGKGRRRGRRKRTAEIILLFSLMLVSVQPRIKQKVVSPYQLNIRLDILSCITEPVVHGAKKLLSQARFSFLLIPSLN